MSSSKQQRKKRWQVHEGKNTICLNGKLIMARDSCVFYLTITLIVVPSVLFFALDCPYLVSQLNAAVPVFGGLLLIIVMGCLLRTSLSDPGILSRATPEEAAFAEAVMARERETEQVSIEASNSAVPWTKPSVRKVLIHGKTVELNYCSTCKFFRPPRASHCSTCDNCIEIFDHHCPWVGNCVGRRNYKYFYMFNVTLSIYGLYLLGFAITALALRLLSSSVADAFKNGWQSVLEIIISFCGFCFVAGMSCYHTHLICEDVSTREKLKQDHSQSGTENPYSHDSSIARFGYALCRAPYPSSLNFEKDVVLPEDEAALVQEIIVKYNLRRAGTTNSQMAPSGPGPRSWPVFDPQSAQNKRVIVNAALLDATDENQIKISVPNEVRVQSLHETPLPNATTRQSSANSRVRVEII